jgi:hypothetical protein
MYINRHIDNELLNWKVLLLRGVRHRNNSKSPLAVSHVDLGFEVKQMVKNTRIKKQILKNYRYN